MEYAWYEKISGLFYLFVILFSKEILYYSFRNMNPMFGVLSL